MYCYFLGKLLKSLPIGLVFLPAVCCFCWSSQILASTCASMSAERVYPSETGGMVEFENVVRSSPVHESRKADMISQLDEGKNSVLQNYFGPNFLKAVHYIANMGSEIDRKGESGGRVYVSLTDIPNPLEGLLVPNGGMAIEMSQIGGPVAFWTLLGRVEVFDFYGFKYSERLEIEASIIKRFSLTKIAQAYVGVLKSRGSVYAMGKDFSGNPLPEVFVRSIPLDRRAEKLAIEIESLRRITSFDSVEAKFLERDGLNFP